MAPFARDVWPAHTLALCQECFRLARLDSVNTWVLIGYLSVYFLELHPNCDGTFLSLYIMSNRLDVPQARVGWYTSHTQAGVCQVVYITARASLTDATLSEVDCSMTYELPRVKVQNDHLESS